MTLQDAINTATRAGFKVHHDEGHWWVTTPKRPRRPSEVQGTFKDETRAWFAAASLAMDDATD
jgi:hypothetical protein